MRASQLAGSTGKQAKKIRQPKDFKACYEGAMYRPADGDWYAIPATSIKAAMISACRLVDFKMTHGKECFQILADGYDSDEHMPLIRMTKGKPKVFEQALRNSNGGADLRVRPLWEAGWEAIVRIRIDNDIFTVQDAANLLMRAGMQVGIGEGREASRKCSGIGWGAFCIKES